MELGGVSALLAIRFVVDEEEDEGEDCAAVCAHIVAENVRQTRKLAQRLKRKLILPCYARNVTREEPGAKIDVPSSRH
jgi:hypothetical protein